MQKFTEIDHLYKPFQQYIVQRTVRGAKEEIPEDDNEERIFFSIFTDYGQTNNLGADWTVDDISEVKARCTSLVKLMNRRRRLEEEVDAGGREVESGLYVVIRRSGLARLQQQQIRKDRILMLFVLEFFFRPQDG